MNASTTPLDLLQRHFGFDEFRPGQESVIAQLLKGHSAAAVFPTGAGKSLCYQLPALAFDGITVVVSPLIALMKDQIDALESRGIPAARIDSSLSHDEWRSVTRSLREGKLRLLFVAPERFQNERFRDMLRSRKVSLFAIDEAHCISEWGHNFRPDYLKLLRYARALESERLLALTATATPSVLKDIVREFGIAPDGVVRTGVYRPNLKLLSTSVDAATRDEVLLERIQSRPAGATIIYVTRQKTAEDVAAMLAREGLPALAYHAGLESDKRSEIQDEFIRSERSIVVATIAFGMGIDKSNIRYVYHYNLSKSLEAYSQEIGRAGRDGEDSVCESLVCVDDLCALENFAHGDTPDEEAVVEFARSIAEHESDFSVSTYELSKRFDIRQLVLETLLTYLQLDGYLDVKTPVFTRFKFKAFGAFEEIVANFQGEPAEFLTALLGQAKQARTWCHLEIDEAAAALGHDRARVVRAMDHIAGRGFIELHNVGLMQRYAPKRSIENLDALASSLSERVLTRERNEIERIHEVLDLVRGETCLVRKLCTHFGEDGPLAGEGGNCGH
ncbi:MAG: ATP-dependent DNA helicase RecQ, partial [Planctomycetota bacterium]